MWQRLIFVYLTALAIFCFCFETSPSDTHKPLDNHDAIPGEIRVKRQSLLFTIPRFFSVFARVIKETRNDTQSAVKQISDILSQAVVNTPATQQENGKRKETATQRKRRLEKARRKYREKRDNEDDAAKRARLEKKRQETKEHRAARLRQARKHAAEVRARETPQQRQARLQRQAQRAAEVRRQARLQRKGQHAAEVQVTVDLDALHIKQEPPSPSSTTEGTAESLSTTTERFTVSRDELVRILRRNYRGLVRLFNQEVDIAVNDSNFNVAVARTEFRESLRQALLPATTTTTTTTSTTTEEIVPRLGGENA